VAFDCPSYCASFLVSVCDLLHIMIAVVMFLLLFVQAERRLRASIESLPDSTGTGTQSIASLGTPPISPSRGGGFRADATPIQEEASAIRIEDQKAGAAGSTFRARHVPGSPPDP
jgi:hypothetical protein